MAKPFAEALLESIYELPGELRMWTILDLAVSMVFASAPLASISDVEASAPDNRLARAFLTAIHEFAFVVNSAPSVYDYAVAVHRVVFVLTTMEKRAVSLPHDTKSMFHAILESTDIVRAVAEGPVLNSRPCIRPSTKSHLMWQ